MAGAKVLDQGVPRGVVELLKVGWSESSSSAIHFWPERLPPSRQRERPSRASVIDRRIRLILSRLGP